MGKVYFVFGVHNHQPVGNFPHIFQQAYERCYLPFLSTVNEFPNIRFSLHNSGPLYDWMQVHAKEYLGMLKQMVKRGQVEIAGGGYYEPILPIISDSDKCGQIRLMSDFIEKTFGVKPQGSWTAERVWEPYVERGLHQCGIRYTFLEDTHFRCAGFKQKEFLGYYTTEDEGRPVHIFPISKTLRYKIPFSKANEAVELMNSFAAEEDILISVFDDGEKFGLWPNTYDWVYNQGWLRQFFSLLEESKTIQTITPQEAIKKFPSSGIAYLPTASYEEMGEWVLEPKSFFEYEELNTFLKNQNRFDGARDFLRAGFFRNFYRKYSRLNYMHKRMLATSRLINDGASPQKDKEIFTALYKAQTNCGYWHGVFGGFYLGHIRSAVYENLTQAQNLFDEKYSKGAIMLHQEDVDLDGILEYTVRNSRMICCFSPKGGSLLELSLRNFGLNLINTITRQEESYHQKIRQHINQTAEVATIHNIVQQKDKDLDKFLIYDSYERLGLIDHLLDKHLTGEAFNAGQGVTTLSDECYKVSARQDKKKVVLDCQLSHKSLDFIKQIECGQECGFDVLYTFRKKNILNDYNFGIEFNISLPSLDDIYKKEKGKEISLQEPQQWLEQSSLTIVDHFKNLVLEFCVDTCDIMTMPLYSVSSSESGFEKVYQQMVILFIAKHKKDTFKLSLRIHAKK